MIDKQSVTSCLSKQSHLNGSKTIRTTPPPPPSSPPLILPALTPLTAQWWCQVTLCAPRISIPCPRGSVGDSVGGEVWSWYDTCNMDTPVIMPPLTCPPALLLSLGDGRSAWLHTTLSHTLASQGECVNENGLRSAQWCREGLWLPFSGGRGRVISGVELIPICSIYNVNSGKNGGNPTPRIECGVEILKKYVAGVLLWS